MNQLKENKGITLIALVVTIIVLLILAGVTIALVLGQNGIFSKAEVAAEKTNEGQELDQVRLAVLEARTNSLVDKTELENELRTSIEKVYPGSEVTNNGDGTYTIKLPNTNTYTVDGNGNVTKGESTTPPTGDLEEVDGVKIPKDFTHIAGDTKEDGIVVADPSKNCEYVWIPVTKDENGNPTQPYAATNGELNGKVIQLRKNVSVQYKEETPEEHTTSGYRNAIAESIVEFKESVAQNGGYFLGRYEAGIEGGTLASTSNSSSDPNWTGYTGGTLVCKAGQQVWNYVTQNKASELCKNIDNNYTGVTSDLVNSYAWDTAIVFIQAFGTESNSNQYETQVGQSKDTNGPFATGTAVLKSPEMIDKQCNIYDMAGNCYEWSTETRIYTGTPCVYRGGYYNSSHTVTSATYSREDYGWSRC